MCRGEIGGVNKNEQAVYMDVSSVRLTTQDLF
jgi:hypothetical protein